MKKIKVLIIDDSALIRQILTRILSAAPDIEVVGTAADPYIAREKIKRLTPDVLTLDVEMPRMDGLAFLRNLMRLHPLPVVMISALTTRGTDVTLQALEYGAVDFITKPRLDITETLDSYAEEIIGKIHVAAQAKINPLQTIRDNSLEITPKYSADVILRQMPKAGSKPFLTTDKIIAIGASTGGTEAIRQVLTQLPVQMHGVVISQHIPPLFSRSFADRMQKLCKMEVCEAEDGAVILPGHVYISPGSHHLLVMRDGARYVCRLDEGAPVNRHRPSVDVMFRSVAQNVGANAIGVILTGMGDDGARGMSEMHETGAITIAQDEHTSVVWGMPSEAIKRGGVDYVLPLYEIAPRLIRLAEIISEHCNVGN
jgi:two-component system chemotaxis response regulator CheB